MARPACPFAVERLQFITAPLDSCTSTPYAPPAIAASTGRELRLPAAPSDHEPSCQISPGHHRTSGADVRAASVTGLRWTRMRWTLPVTRQRWGGHSTTVGGTFGPTGPSHHPWCYYWNIFLEESCSDTQVVTNAEVENARHKTRCFSGELLGTRIRNPHPQPTTRFGTLEGLP